MLLYSELGCRGNNKNVQALKQQERGFEPRLPRFRVWSPTELSPTQDTSIRIIPVHNIFFFRCNKSSNGSIPFQNHCSFIHLGAKQNPVHQLHSIDMKKTEKMFHLKQILRNNPFINWDDDRLYLYLHHSTLGYCISFILDRPLPKISRAR